MSSSESDDEDRALFLEAIDHEFIDNISMKVDTEEKKITPSLRPRTWKTVTNELNVTPEFQDYVAKHLDNIIKRQIKEVTGTVPVNTIKVNEHDGIRMFSNSKKLVRSRDLDPEVEFRNRVRRKKKKLQLCHSEKNSSSDESERERLREAAVSPEWVLKKEGAYGKCCEKGRIIRLLSIGNGHFLECLEDSRNEQSSQLLSTN